MPRDPVPLAFVEDRLTFELRLGVLDLDLLWAQARKPVNYLSGRAQQRERMSACGSMQRR